MPFKRGTYAPQDNLEETRLEIAAGLVLFLVATVGPLLILVIKIGG